MTRQIINLEKIKHAMQAAAEIAGQQMPGKTAFVLAKLFSALDKENKLFEIVRVEIAKKMHLEELDQECNVIREEISNANGIKIIEFEKKLKAALIEFEKAQSKFTHEITQVLKQEVEINTPLLPQAMLEELNLSPKCIMDLDYFIEAN